VINVEGVEVVLEGDAFRAEAGDGDEILFDPEVGLLLLVLNVIDPVFIIKSDNRMK